MKVVELGQGAPPPRTGSAAGSWRAITRVLRSCSASLRDDSVTTAFPADCPVCGGPMTAWTLVPVCDACVRSVEPQAGTLCDLCGEALGFESARFAAAMGSKTCTMCRLAPPEFTRAVAYATYDDEVREMLHMLKYSGVQRLAQHPLSAWLAQAAAMLGDSSPRDLLVIAVPLFPARERRRGFNQSTLLADAAIAALKKLRPAWKLQAAHRAMQRVRDTEAQFGLLPGQRRRNLRGAFRVVDAEAVRDRSILLVDDIMTTGATARECARVLIRAGASRVFVATLARAQAESAAPNAATGTAIWDAVIEPRKEQRVTFSGGAA